MGKIGVKLGKMCKIAETRIFCVDLILQIRPKIAKLAKINHNKVYKRI